MFSIVVPLVKDHDAYIPKLFATLSIEKELVTEIIIARSHLPSNQNEHFERFIKASASDAGLIGKEVLVKSESKQNAAQNRNAGGMKAKSQWICFLDADDDYSEFRLRYLCQIIKNHSESNLILHSYTYKNELLNWPMPTNFEKCKDKIKRETQKFVASGDQGNSNLNVPVKGSGLNRIHHGHITVKKEVFQKVKFQANLREKEDGVFCNSVLREFGGAYYLPTALSLYNIERSATNKSPLKKIIQKLQSKLSDN
jgi:glycosyltransferase involved in cell wall biosynthesis